MSEKELMKYRNYLRLKDRKKINWIKKIKFWKYLKKDYDKQVIENARKSDEIHNLKMKLQIAEQSIEHLESDIKNFKKKN